MAGDEQERRQPNPEHEEDGAGDFRFQGEAGACLDRGAVLPGAARRRLQTGKFWQAGALPRLPYASLAPRPENSRHFSPMASFTLNLAQKLGFSRAFAACG